MDSVDWTGVAPSDAPIEALTEEVFIRRLNLLSQRARDILILRAAVNNQTGAGRPQDLFDVTELKNVKARSRG